MPEHETTSGAAAAPATRISTAMQKAVGREIRTRVSFPVSASDIRRWAIAVYYPEDPPRLFWDTAYAVTTEHGGIVAPEEFNPFAWMSADPPGMPALSTGGFDPDSVETALGITGPGLKNMLNGGLESDYERRMRPGDVVTAVSRLHAYRERQGRLGTMLFTTSEDTWTNQEGAVIKKMRSTLIRY